MKNLVTLMVLFFSIGIVSLNAQIQQTENVTFQSSGQSLWDPEPGVALGDTFLLLQDNGVDASFFLDLLDIDAMADGDLATGFQTKIKFGMDYDMYARYLINSGTADIDYPIEIKFTKPNDGNYGCSQEMLINSAYSVKPGYKLELQEPIAEFAMGNQLNMGIMAAARGCFFGECDEAGYNVGSGMNGFLDANSSNYHNYLVDGYYDYLRISTGDGLQLPWDLVPGIPEPPGIPNYTFPMELDPAVFGPANIEGMLDQPFRDFDKPDMVMGQAIVDKGSHKFMDIEFDPIHFQEEITRIPLAFTVQVGPIYLDFAVISVPLIFRNNFKHEFKFDPKVKVNLDLGKPMAWRELKAGVNVQTGNGQYIENFTLGNDLALTLPDNDPVSIVPTVKITNQFSSKLDLVFDFSIGFRLMEGEIKIDLDEDGPLDPVLDKDFAAFTKEFPVGTVVNNVLNKTFEMGGFNTATLNPIQLHPDVTPPSITTKNITVYIPDAGGSVTINPQDVVLNAFDGQGGTIRYLSVTPNAFDCSNLGQNIVGVTIDDSRCNTTNATAFVTVADRTQPTVVCKNATVYLDGLGQGYLNASDVYQSGWDNCGTVNVVSISKETFNCSNIGANTVSLSVNDGHGNTNACTATVTVIDNMAPTVSCQPTTVYLNAAGSATVNPASIFLSGADNCGTVNLQAATPGSFICNNIGDNLVFLTVNDGHGNTAVCNTTVTVLDKIAPTVVCKPATVDLNNNGTGSINTASVFQSGADNCGVVNQESVVPNTFECSNLGINTVVLTVNDSHGNTNTCTATVTVRDLIKPVANCPANISTQNDLGVCGANVSYSATATDNCSIASLNPVPASGSLFNVGTTSVTYTATDIAGNTATCVFSVTVSDTESPVLTCPANIELENELGKCNAVATYTDATATDNCGVQSVVKLDGLPSGSVFPVGVSYVSYRATDIYNNTSTCSFSIEIRDTEAPKMVCPQPLNKPNDFGDCGRRMQILYTPNGLSDNCGVSTVTSNWPLDFPIGETLVTWTILDIHGNTASCDQKVTIFDQDWPIVNCPQTMKIKTDEGYCEASNVAFSATATDNCPGVVLEYDHDPNYLFPVGYTNVEATATDIHGHQSKCVFQVVVETRPEICNGIDDDCDGFADEVQDWQETFRAEMANGQANHQLGSSVAIDGDWALVGAAGGSRAYLLHRNDSDPSEWDLVTEFENGSANDDDLFGNAVSLHNGIAVVGAPNDGTQGNNAGAVHIFAQDPNDATHWPMLKTVFAPDATSDANFGKTVKIKGGMLVVGATGANAAYVFKQNEGGPNNWGSLQKLIPSDGANGDEFGQSLDFNQQMVVVGAPNKGAGAAYSFDPTNGWIETQKILPTFGDPADRFAQSISLEGRRMLIGAPGDDDKATNAGACYVFGKTIDGPWLQQGKIIDVANGTAGDAFGHCVSLQGEYAAIGAPLDDLRGKDAGAVHIFYREDGGWFPLIALTQFGSQTSDYFGQSLQLQPGTLIAGTPGDNIGTQMDRGSAAIFEGLCSPGAGQREDELPKASETANVTMSPNPSTGNVTLSFQLSEEQDCMVRAFDLSGRLVYQHQNKGIEGENVLPITMLGVAPGVYMVEFQAGDLKVTQRLIVTE